MVADAPAAPPVPVRPAHPCCECKTCQAGSHDGSSIILPAPLQVWIYVAPGLRWVTWSGAGQVNSPHSREWYAHIPLVLFCDHDGTIADDLPYLEHILLTLVFNTTPALRPHARTFLRESLVRSTGYKLG